MKRLALFILCATILPNLYGDIKFSSINDSTLAMLTSMSYCGIPLYISKKQLQEVEHEPARLKELFEQYPFEKWQMYKDCKDHGAYLFNDRWPKADDRTFWNQIMASFYTQAEKDKKELDGHYTYLVPELVMLPALLADAKSILTSFLAQDDDLDFFERMTFNSSSSFGMLIDSQQRFIQKSGMHRLFTYAELERTIEKEKLSHIRLPRKILVLRDGNTRKYLLHDEAKKIIDNDTVIALDPFGCTIRIHNSQEGSCYDMIVFAEKIKASRKSFNKNAQEELKKLCQKSPFDIGFDNIFSDTHGDAVIIDTESKCTPSHDCAKLDRYFR